MDKVNKQSESDIAVPEIMGAVKADAYGHGAVARYLKF